MESWTLTQIVTLVALCVTCVANLVILVTGIAALRR